MLVVFNYHEGDANSLLKNLVLMKRFDERLPHKCLLVTTTETSKEIQTLVRDVTESVFADVKQAIFRINPALKGKWPQVCNVMFQSAYRIVREQYNEPFFWMEADCVPLKSGWLDALQKEYTEAGKPFMGVVYDWVSATRKLPHLTGCAIYPSNLSAINPAVLKAVALPWDVTLPAITLARTHQTKLFHHEWGDRKNNIAPTFPHQKNLATINKEAVLFHRCKDGSLQDRLWAKNWPPQKNSWFHPKRMLVVIPCCQSDLWLAQKNLEWAIEMDKHCSFDCLISGESGMTLEPLKSLCAQFFQSVNVLIRPSPTIKQWPQVNNECFQATARHVLNFNHPSFFWWEPDATPLKPGWLDALWQSHVASGKPFSGHMVWGMGHINGTAIYPRDVFHYSPLSLLTKNGAWDYISRYDIKDEQVNCINPLFQHIWTGADLIYSGNGPAPSFEDGTLESKVIYPGACMFHRCKDGTLIDRLREGVTPIPTRFHHVYSDYPAKGESKRRHELSKRTWTAEYQTGLWVSHPVFDSELSRDSRQTGDTKSVPFIRDLVESCLTKMADEDFIVLTNHDTCFAPGMTEAVLNTLKQHPATWSRRRDFKHLSNPLTSRQCAQGQWYFGVDIFIFSKAFWIKHESDFPDFLLSYECWDWVMWEWLKKHGGTETPNLIYHEKHDSFWEQPANRFSHPCQQHNIRLGKAWLKQNHCQLGSFANAPDFKPSLKQKVKNILTTTSV